jgi:hypothetical protein
MRQITIAIAVALLAAACTNTERGDSARPYSAYSTRPLPPVGATADDLGMSSGSTDSITSGSVSNAASGSTATQQTFP